jgi:hypothetical protein
MFQVESDIAKNRLYVRLVGYFEEQDLKAASDAVITEAKKLRTGFDMISDIAQLKPTNANGLKELQRVQQFLKLRGLRRMVRVVGIVISQVQVERTGTEAGYEGEHAHSRAEAEALLDVEE